MDRIESYGSKFSLKAMYSCQDGLVGSAFGSWWITAWFAVLAILLSLPPAQNIWKHLETLMAVTTRNRGKS